MLTLLEHIDRLVQWCDCSKKPQHKEIRILDTLDSRVRYAAGQPTDHGWACPPAALQKPEHYADKFNELQVAGYSWINLSLYGILDLVLIVGIELPGGGPRGVPAGKTSVNYSGPRINTLTGQLDWRAPVHVAPEPHQGT